MKRPATQFYWADHFRDPGIRATSLAARGLWWDMLCMMHEGEPYGHLTVGEAKVSDAQLARMTGEAPAIAADLLKELEDNRVFSRTEAGVIFCRRMVRDELKRSLHAEAGKMGGNPKLIEGRTQRVKPQVKPRDKLTDENPPNQKPTPSSSSSSSTALQQPPERIYAFMGEIRPVWRHAYGGEIPPGSARRLQSVINEFGADEVARRFTIYCEATDAEFASVAKFVSTIGRWGAASANGERIVGVGGVPSPDELKQAGIFL